MSAFWPGNMRGLQLKIPVLLLMLWLSALTNTVFCQEYEDEYPDSDTVTEDKNFEEPAADATTIELAVSSATSPFPTEDPSLSSEDNDKLGSGDDEKNNLNEEIPFSTSFEQTESTFTPGEGEDSSLTTILIPVVVGVVIISIIVGGIIANRKWSQKATNKQSVKEDPYLDGSSTDKVPMPMFEEDVPSVLELEMEELDQWIKKDSGPAESLNQA